jgi:hypothetical protein
VAWAWKEFIKKREDCEEEKAEEKTQPAPQDNTTTVP